MTAHIPFHPELTIHHPVRPRAGHAGRLVAIVVTHNRITQLRTTVLALLADPADRLHALVVVNNASTDDSADWLDSQPDPRLHVLHLNRNIGGAGGFAAGLDHARRSFDPDWFVLMDDDARPRPDALQVFHSSDLAGWDAIAGAAYHPHGAICDINRPTLDPFSNWRKFLRTLCAGREGFHLNTTAYAQKSPVQVDGASFVGLFLSRRAITLGVCLNMICSSMAMTPCRHCDCHGQADALHSCQQLNSSMTQAPIQSCKTRPPCGRCIIGTETR